MRTVFPYIHSVKADAALILAPAWAATFIALVWTRLSGAGADTPSWLWFALVVGVDVAHVYATLFRVYFDKTEFRRRPLLYTLAPFVCYGVGIALYAADKMTFWRALAYLAVFHFVRQQYGFMRIYARRETFAPSWARRLDALAIYSATLYPILYWHATPRKFHWFLAGDFFTGIPPEIASVGGWLYLFILISYISKETYFSFQNETFNFAKNLLIFGTYISWYIGIVALDGDLAFTLTNVLTHGLPYLGLTWFYYARAQKTEQNPPHDSYSHLYARAAGFVVLLIGLAYIEETFWDRWFWREHGQFFGDWGNVLASQMAVWVAPLLATPQTTHYVLDAFVWKLKGKHADWQKNALAPR